MFEKVNPAHPDKIADRIAGAVIDYAYSIEERPCVSVEVLAGHDRGLCLVESSIKLSLREIEDICRWRSTYSNENGLLKNNIKWDIQIKPQDKHLNKNQKKAMRCGDNGIFKGCPVTHEEQELVNLVNEFWKYFGSDGKYLLDADTSFYKELTICQSKMKNVPDSIDLSKYMVLVNPLGFWEGGLGVDSGSVNRKLGSDMGQAVLGGGLHGRDVSKADVTLNIICHILAQKLCVPVYSKCSIGDEKVRFWTDYDCSATKELLEQYSDKIYEELAYEALDFIKSLGGFEKFAEWGLIRPQKKKPISKQQTLIKEEISLYKDKKAAGRVYRKKHYRVVS